MIRSQNAALLALSLVLQGAFARDACAQEAEGAEAAPAEEAPAVEVFSVHWAGIDALFTSPKDRGLVRALRMLDDRLAELPAELGKEGEAPPPELLPLLAALCEGRTALHVGFSEPDPASLPFFARLEVDGTGTAPAPATLLAGLFVSTGLELEAPDADGRVALPMPVPAWYRDDDGKLVVVVGAEGARAAEEPIALLPTGAVEALRVRIDYAALVEHGLPTLEGMGADVGGLRPLLDATGMSSVTIETALGSDATRSYVSTTYRGLGDTAVADMLADAPIPLSALDLVPADAEWAVVSAYDLAEIADFYRDLFETMASAAPDEDEDEEARQVLAILADLGENFLRHVGGVQGMYASDTTGGGGLCSTVAFASLADPPAFTAALDERLARLEEFGRGVARGYVRLSREDTQGARITSLVFAGLPIPFEPTYAVAGGNLFVGLSRQSVLGALAHALSGAPGLSANASFAAQMDAVPPDLHGLFFFDTPRLLRGGYAQAARVATAVGNLVRSPSDVERELGDVLPPFAELQDGALAMVWTTRLRGGDFVLQGRADRSKLVNATALGGYFGNMYALFLLGGIASGIAQSQEAAPPSDAEALRARSDIEAIERALHAYAFDHDGAYPVDLAELEASADSGNAYLEDGLPSDPWGRPYQYKARKRDGMEPRVSSFGADGQRGGTGHDRDIRADTKIAEPKGGLKALLEKLFE